MSAVDLVKPEDRSWPAYAGWLAVKGMGPAVVPAAAAAPGACLASSSRTA
jgi:hypothetical protein